MEHDQTGSPNKAEEFLDLVTYSEQLKRVNQQLAQAQQIAHIGSWEWDVVENKISWSDELYKIYGVAKENFKTDYENYLHCIHPEDRQFANDIVQQAYANHLPFNFYHRIIRPDGKTRVLHGSGEVITDEKGAILKMSGTAQDVTERKKTEEEMLKANDELAKKNLELEKTRTFLQTVLDASVEMITTCGKDLNCTSINKRGADFLNKKKEDIIGRNLSELSPALRDSEYVENLFRALKGEMIYLDVVKSLIHPGRYIEAFFIPLVIQKEITGILIMERDITDIKWATEKLTEANALLETTNFQLVQSNAELASFNYVASHDLQEPLRKIQAFSNHILDKEYKTFSPVTKDYFERIVAASARMQNLILALLNYSRTNSSDLSLPTDLNMILEEVKRTLSEQMEGSDIVIMASALPTLNVVPYQFNQLFLNIISNSIKYRKPATGLLIKISAEKVKANQTPNGAPEDEQYWEIRIEDNGIGFEMQYTEKIFELFQRLHSKTEYGGTGIGLAICKKIIQNHKGFIKASGMPGIGACFSFYVPVNDSETGPQNNLISPGNSQTTYS